MKKPFLLLLVLAISGAAAWDIVTRKHWGRFEDYMCRQTAAPFFRVSGPGEGRIVVPARTGAPEFSFSMPKAPGVKRIFVIGESAAGLLARPGKDSFAGVFRSFYGGPVEIINCGMGAYDSSRIYGVFSEALEFSPDLIVLLSGNNEVGPKVEACPGPAGFFKAGWRWLRAAAFSAGPGWQAGRRLETDRTHAARLERMASAAQRSGAGLMLCTLPYTPAFPPFGPMPLNAPSFSAGFSLLRQGAYGGAQARFREYLSERPGDTFGLYYQGLAAARAGDGKLARELYEQALLADPRMDRAGAARNKAVRVLAARTGACLADLEAALAGRRPSPLADGVHWHKRYDRVAAMEILRGLSACGAADLPLKSGKDKLAAAAEAPLTPPNREELREEAKTMLNYAAAFLLFPPAQKPYLNSRVLYQLEGACRRAPGFIKEALSSEESLAAALKGNVWVGEMAEGVKALLPLLREHAAGPCNEGKLLFN